VHTGGDDALEDERESTATTGGVRDDIEEHLARPNARPKLLWVNLVLTIALMTVLVADVVEPSSRSWSLPASACSSTSRGWPSSPTAVFLNIALR
jgi:hypothetical protein